MTDEARKSDLVDIRCRVITESPSGKALLIDDGTVKAWVPKSQVEVDYDRNFAIVTMRQWLAEEKGFA